MKTSRFQYEYRDSASSYHKVVGECLRDSTLFNGHEIYQEYPVNRINTEYPHSSHHFDWVIMGLHLVIEVHGEQHYKAIDFSGKSEDGGIMALKRTRARDRQKRQAAIDAGWTYVVIPFDKIDQVDEDFIWALYKENLNEAIRLAEPTKEEPSSYHRQRLAIAREYRKGQYQRAKARRVEMQSRRAAESSLQTEGTPEDEPQGT